MRLREALVNHREIMEAIAKLSPDTARELLGLHAQHRYPLRAALWHHGLAPKHVPIEGMRAMAAPFASHRALCIERRVAELRTDPKDVET